MLFNQVKELVKSLIEIFGGDGYTDERVLIFSALDYLTENKMDICENRQDELKLTIWLRDKIVKTNKTESSSYEYSTTEFGG